MDAEQGLGLRASWRRLLSGDLTGPEAVESPMAGAPAA